MSEADLIADLGRLFSAFDVTEQTHAPVPTHVLSDTGNIDSRAHPVPVEFNDENMLRYRRNVQAMLQCCGFLVDRRPSTLVHGGTGVFVTSGAVRAGHVTSLYPGNICSYTAMALQHKLVQFFGVKCMPGMIFAVLLWSKFS